MATEADVRKIALSLDGTSEVQHWDRPAWRTTRRLYAVLRPDGLWLHMPIERREFLFEADPDVFVKYMWGKSPELIVQYKKVSKTELAALLRESWEYGRPATKKARGQKR